ncbi:hypothetical protein NCLIV_053020 [Neospora caninum Liverpool]|uniref:SUN domain-containing protein n=1 Tax=Neospora caninum (strain Liverpool) TaxID=572307 RepID=F0VLC5_NEOCL|nr:hypothetical protein NCLIV_053020 [Neospora caninum Liverpool]CBZ54877.1 hypothetical protein NCLIV_053020 [Neospora caninum Liverpool]|eukprot:XP_003884905.1 hypothetical protein NCLIV_053020 [Neospora caninum Liverpool]
MPISTVSSHASGSSKKNTTAENGHTEVSLCSWLATPKSTACVVRVFVFLPLPIFSYAFSSQWLFVVDFGSAVSSLAVFIVSFPPVNPRSQSRFARSKRVPRSSFVWFPSFLVCTFLLFLSAPSTRVPLLSPGRLCPVQAASPLEPKEAQAPSSSPTAVEATASPAEGDTPQALHVSPAVATERTRDGTFPSFSGGQEIGSEEGEEAETESLDTGEKGNAKPIQGQTSAIHLGMKAKPSQETRDASPSLGAGDGAFSHSFPAQTGDRPGERNVKENEGETGGRKEDGRSVNADDRMQKGEIHEKTAGSEDRQQKKKEANEEGDSEGFDGGKAGQGGGDGNVSSSSASREANGEGGHEQDGSIGAAEFNGVGDRVKADAPTEPAGHARGEGRHGWQAETQGEETEKETEPQYGNDGERVEEEEVVSISSPSLEHQHEARDGEREETDGVQISEVSLKESETQQSEKAEGQLLGHTAGRGSVRERFSSPVSAIQEPGEARRETGPQDTEQANKEETACEVVNALLSAVSPSPSSPYSSSSSPSSLSFSLSSSPSPSPSSSPSPSPSSSPSPSPSSPASSSPAFSSRGTIREGNATRSFSHSPWPSAPSSSVSALGCQPADVCFVSFHGVFSLSSPCSLRDVAAAHEQPEGEPAERRQAYERRQKGEEGREEGRGARKIFSRALGLISSLTNLLSAGRSSLAASPSPPSPAGSSASPSSTRAPEASLSSVASPFSPRLPCSLPDVGAGASPAAPRCSCDPAPGRIPQRSPVDSQSHQGACSLSSPFLCADTRTSTAGVGDSLQATAASRAFFLPGRPLTTELRCCRDAADSRPVSACASPFVCLPVPRSPVREREIDACPVFASGSQALFGSASSCAAPSEQREEEERRIGEGGLVSECSSFRSDSSFPCSRLADSFARDGEKNSAPRTVEADAKGTEDPSRRSPSDHATAGVSPAGECRRRRGADFSFFSACMCDTSEEGGAQNGDSCRLAGIASRDAEPQREATECAEGDGEMEGRGGRKRTPEERGGNEGDRFPVQARRGRGGLDWALTSSTPSTQEQMRDSPQDGKEAVGENEEDGSRASQGREAVATEGCGESVRGEAAGAENATTQGGDSVPGEEGGTQLHEVVAGEKWKSVRGLWSPSALLLRRCLPLSVRRLVLAPLKALRRRMQRPLRFPLSRGLAGAGAPREPQRGDGSQPLRETGEELEKAEEDQETPAASPGDSDTGPEGQLEGDGESAGESADASGGEGTFPKPAAPRLDSAGASLSDTRSEAENAPESEAVPRSRPTPCASAACAPEVRSRPAKAELSLNGRPFLRGRAYEAEAQKLKFDFASVDAGARIVASSRGVTNIKSVQRNDLDSYMLVPCQLQPKFFVISFTEPIHVEQVAVASMEIYASAFRHIQLLGSDVYPTKQWRLLANLETNPREAQEIFDVKRECAALHGGQACWAKYLKVRLLSYHVVEAQYYYCSLTSFHVFGSTGFQMLESHIHNEGSPDAEASHGAAEAEGGDSGDSGDSGDAGSSGEARGGEGREGGGVGASSSGERQTEAGGRSRDAEKEPDDGHGEGADEERGRGESGEGFMRTRDGVAGNEGDREEKRRGSGDEGGRIGTSSEDLETGIAAASPELLRDRGEAAPSPQERKPTPEEDDEVEEERSRGWAEQTPHGREKVDSSSAAAEVLGSAETGLSPSAASRPSVLSPTSVEEQEADAPKTPKATQEEAPSVGRAEGIYSQGQGKNGEEEAGAVRRLPDSQGGDMGGEGGNEGTRSEASGKAGNRPSSGDMRAEREEEVEGERGHRREQDGEGTEGREREPSRKQDQEEHVNKERRRPSFSPASPEEGTSGASRTGTEASAPPSSSTAEFSPAAASEEQREAERTAHSGPYLGHLGTVDKKDGKQDEKEPGPVGIDGHRQSETRGSGAGAHEETADARRDKGEQRGHERGEEQRPADQMHADPLGPSHAPKTPEPRAVPCSNCEEEQSSRPRAPRASAGADRGGDQGSRLRSETPRADEGTPASRKKPSPAPPPSPQGLAARESEAETEREGLLRQLHRWRGIARLPLLFSPSPSFPLGGTGGGPAGGASLLRSVLNYFFPSWNPVPPSRASSVVYESHSLSPSFSLFSSVPSFSSPVSPLKRPERPLDGDRQEAQEWRTRAQRAHEGDRGGTGSKDGESPGRPPGAANWESPDRVVAHPEGGNGEELAEGGSSPQRRSEATAKHGSEGEDGVPRCEEDSKRGQRACGTRSPSSHTPRMPPPRGAAVSADPKEPRPRPSGPFPGLERLFSRRRPSPFRPDPRLPRSPAPSPRGAAPEERRSTVEPLSPSASSFPSPSARSTFPASSFPFPAFLPQNTILEDLLAWADRGGGAQGLAAGEHVPGASGTGDNFEGTASFLASSSLSPILPLLAQRRNGEAPSDARDGAKALAPVVAATFAPERSAAAKLASEADTASLATRGSALSQQQQQDLLQLLLQNLPVAAATASASLFPSGFPASRGVVESLAADLSAPSPAPASQSKSGASGSVSTSSSSAPKGAAKTAAASASQGGDKSSSSSAPKESAPAASVSSPKGSGHVLLTLVDRMKAAESQGAHLKEKLNEVVLSLHSNQQQTLQQAVLLQLLLELVSFLYMRLSKFDVIVPRLPFLLDFSDSGAAAAASFAAKRTTALKSVSSASGAVVGDGDTPAGQTDTGPQQRACSGNARDFSQAKKTPGLDSDLLSFKGEGPSDGGGRDFFASVSSLFGGNEEADAARPSPCGGRRRWGQRKGTRPWSPKKRVRTTRKEGARCGGTRNGEGREESGGENACVEMDAESKTKDCVGFEEGEGDSTFGSDESEESFSTTALRFLTSYLVTAFSYLAILTEEACFVVVAPMLDAFASSASTPQSLSTSQGRSFCLHMTETVTRFLGAAATLHQNISSSLIECWRQAIKWDHAGGLSPGDGDPTEKGPNPLSLFLLLLFLHLAYGVFILRLFSKRTNEAAARAEAAVRECEALRLSLASLLRAPTGPEGHLGRGVTAGSLEMESSGRNTGQSSLRQETGGEPGRFAGQENGAVERALGLGDRKDAENAEKRGIVEGEAEERTPLKTETLPALAASDRPQEDHVSRSHPVSARRESRGYERFRLASLALKRDTMKWERHRNDALEQRRQSFDLSYAAGSARSSLIHPLWQRKEKLTLVPLKNFPASPPVDGEKDPEPGVADLRQQRRTPARPSPGVDLSPAVPFEDQRNLSRRSGSSCSSRSGGAASFGDGRAWAPGGTEGRVAGPSSVSHGSQAPGNGTRLPLSDATHRDATWREDAAVASPSEVKSGRVASLSSRESWTGSVHSSVRVSPSPALPFFKHKRRTNTSGNLDGSRQSGWGLRAAWSPAEGSRGGDRGGTEEKKGEERKASHRKTYGGQSHGNRKAFKLQRHTVKGLSGSCGCVAAPGATGLSLVSSDFAAEVSPAGGSLQAVAEATPAGEATRPVPVGSLCAAPPGDDAARRGDTGADRTAGRVQPAWGVRGVAKSANSESSDPRSEVKTERAEHANGLL